MPRLILTVIVMLALSMPAHAGDVDDPFSAAAGAFVRGLVQEEDVGLFFGYLREALAAAADGREAPVPDKLTRRAEEIGERAKQRGVVAGGMLLDAIEASVREMVRELPR